MDPNHEEAREDLIHANLILTELKRRETDFDMQLRLAGLTPEEEDVARCKRNLLERGKLVSSDCTLQRAPRLGELMASTGPNEVFLHDERDDDMVVS